MQRILPFIFLIVVLTSGVAVAAKALDRNIIMADWKNRRCDMASIFFAPLFKSPDDSRSYVEFAADNLDFCMKTLQSAAVDSAMQPLYSTANAQLAATGSIAGAMNNLRATLSNIMSSTKNAVLVTFYDEFKRYIAAVSLTMQRIRMAMNRVSASTQAMLYMAISTVRAILNAIDFILLVALIVVTIIAILFIILFFVLFPSVPLILTVISLLLAAGIQVGNLRDTFCFAPHTLVKLADGSVVPIASVELGEMLWGGVKLEGMYVFDGGNSQMFDLRGVHVAGDHIVRSDDERWIYVKDHPDARKIEDRYMRVYCPVVEGRELTVCAAAATALVFKDWEEVDDDAAEREWERWAWSHLNPGKEYTAAADIQREMAQGFSPSTTVTVYGRGIIPLADVKIGDMVLDMGADQYTQVRGLYDGCCTGPTLSSNWIRSADGIWKRALTPVNDTRLKHLVTESGTFCINGEWVRDATEVGNNAIAGSYDTIISLLNRK